MIQHLLIESSIIQTSTSVESAQIFGAVLCPSFCVCTKSYEQQVHFESCWQDRRQQRLHATNLRSVLTDSVFDLWSPKSLDVNGLSGFIGFHFPDGLTFDWLFFLGGVDSIFLESCTKELISLTTSQTPDSSGIIYCQRQKDCEALLRVDLQKPSEMT